MFPVAQRNVSSYTMLYSMFPTTHGEFDKFSSYATSPAMYTAKPCYILDIYISMTRLSLLRTIIVYIIMSRFMRRLFLRFIFTHTDDDLWPTFIYMVMDIDIRSTFLSNA